MRARTLLLLTLAALAASCKASSPGPAPVSHAFDGTWAACRTEDTGDVREVLVVDGADGTLELLTYATADGTCDGDPTSDAQAPLTVAYGGQVSATLGAGQVQATAVDITLGLAPPETFYTLAWRDTAAAPEALHIGDDSGPLDGSTPALRPTALQPLGQALQSPLAAADLSGEWWSCPVEGDGRVLAIDAAAGTFVATKYAGPCWTGAVQEVTTATFGAPAPVLASHGATTVTALAVDLALTAPEARTVHMTFWVDTPASPRRLHVGNDELHGMDGATPSLRPRVLRAEWLERHVAPFAQADLSGEWDVLRFTTNGTPGWALLHVRIDGAGLSTVLSRLTHDGDTTLPTGPMAPLTVDASGDVRRAAGGTFRGRMASTKALVVGTEDALGLEGGVEVVKGRNLVLYSRRVPGVTFGAADLAGLTMSLHSASSGPDRTWFRATATTDAGGVLSFTDFLDSTGASGSAAGVAHLVIDAAGRVENAGGVLRCVMASDKRALFCLDTGGDAPDLVPSMGVYVVTGGTVAQADLAGSWFFHNLISGADTAASSWQRGPNTVDVAGNLAFTSFLGSNGSTTPPAPRQILVSPGGALTTAADATYHGQLSRDGAFWVRTSMAGAVGPSLGFNVR